MTSAPVPCPSCHAAVSIESAVFCPYCGKRLFLSTSIPEQIIIYLVSIFLPPFGFYYAWNYLRRTDEKMRAIGLIAAMLTIFSVIAAIWLGKTMIDSVNQALQSSLGGIGAY